MPAMLIESDHLFDKDGHSVGTYALT